jgi:hypothetical protein
VQSVINHQYSVLLPYFTHHKCKLVSHTSIATSGLSVYWLTTLQKVDIL